MKHLLNYILISIFCVLVIRPAFSQINIRIAKKDYTIPAFIKVPGLEEYEKEMFWVGIHSKELNYSQAKSRNKDIFEQLELLEPIQNSLYDIEVRLVNSSPFFSSNVIVLKGNSKKLIAEYYEYGQHKAIPGKAYKMKKLSNMTFYYLKQSLSIPDTLLASLIKNKLFNYDPIAVRDSLKKAGRETSARTYLDGSPPSFYIKVKNDYHFISCDPYALEENKGTIEVAPETLLTHTFYNLTKLLNK
jgi:hypothetical protein